MALRNVVTYGTIRLEPSEEVLGLSHCVVGRVSAFKVPFGRVLNRELRGFAVTSQTRYRRH